MLCRARVFTGVRWTNDEGNLIFHSAKCVKGERESSVCDCESMHSSCNNFQIFNYVPCRFEWLRVLWQVKRKSMTTKWLVISAREKNNARVDNRQQNKMKTSIPTLSPHKTLQIFRILLTRRLSQPLQQCFLLFSHRFFSSHYVENVAIAHHKILNIELKIKNKKLHASDTKGSIEVDVTTRQDSFAASSVCCLTGLFVRPHFRTHSERESTRRLQSCMSKVLLNKNRF